MNSHLIGTSETYEEAEELAIKQFSGCYRDKIGVDEYVFYSPDEFFKVLVLKKLNMWYVIFDLITYHNII